MRRIDMSRLRASVSGPGIDPRVWVATARVDDDPDAVRWDDSLGWLVDVTIVGGPFDGEGPVVCRVLTGVAGAGVTSSRPPRFDGLVVVAIPGDVNQDAFIVGQVHDTDHPPPSEINGDELDEELALKTHITVAPDEDLDQQWRSVRITAESMTLGAADADQSFVRGEDQAGALEQLVGALVAAITAINAAIPTGVSDPTAIGTLQAAAEAFEAARSTYLSTRLKGD